MNYSLTHTDTHTLIANGKTMRRYINDKRCDIGAFGENVFYTFNARYLLERARAQLTCVHKARTNTRCMNNGNMQCLSEAYR